MGSRRRVCSALIRLGAPTGSSANPRCSSGMAADRPARTREQTGRASVRLLWLTLPSNVPFKTLRTVVLKALPVANGRRLRAGTCRDLLFFNFGLNFHFRLLLLHVMIVYLSRCLSVVRMFVFYLWSSWDWSAGFSTRRKWTATLPPTKLRSKNLRFFNTRTAAWKRSVFSDIIDQKYNISVPMLRQIRLQV